MVSFELASTVTFFAIVAVLLFVDRKNFEFHYGLIIRKWTKGINRIDGFVRKHRTFTERVGDAGVAVGIPAGIIGLVTILYFSLTLQPGLQLALPSVGGFQYPGPIISVPFWFWILIIFISIMTHESMHAVQARVAGVPVKSYGLLFFLFFPIGAFVDPVTEKIKKLSLMKKLRIFAAGSFINMVNAVFAIVIMFVSPLVADFLMPGNGVNFEKAQEGTPAANANLQGAIVEIQGQRIKNQNDLVKVFDSLKPDQIITIKTTEGTYTLRTTERPDVQGRAYMGILKPYTVLPQWFLEGRNLWFEFLKWLIVLSLGIGIANLLPAKPLDGGLIFEELFRARFGKRAGTLIKISTALTFGTILFSLFGVPLIRAFLI